MKRFYAASKLSDRRETTPEGYLVCYDVCLASVGTMPYAEQQLQFRVPGINGRVDITRDEDVLFAPETLASFEGKSFTMGHPPELLTAKNTKQYDRGHVQNVRRGEGSFKDYMIGDILVKDAATIDAINSGTVQISNGYDAEYEATKPGHGRQTRIVGNHVALVSKGRNGPTCYIADEIGDETMTETVDAETKGLLDGLKALFAPKGTATFDAAAVQAEVAKGIAPMETAIAGLTAAIAKLTPTADTETAEQKAAREAAERAASAPTLDAAYIARVSSAAEILSPGAKLATFDAADPVAGKAAVAALQKTALAAAYAKPEGKTAIEGIAPGFKAEVATQDQLDAAFFGASALMGALNNNIMSAMALASGAGSEFKTAQERILAADANSLKRWNKTA